MIVTIKGNIVSKEPNEVIIEAGGLGYACKISTNTYDDLKNVNDKVKLLTYFHVTENSQSLFAF